MVWFILILLILTISTSIYFKKDAVVCLPFSLLSINFILYFSLLVYNIYLGFLILGLVCSYSVYFVFKSILKKKIKINDYVHFNFLFPIALILFIYVMVIKAKIICYDEFTAWGLYAKNIFYTKNLYIYSPYLILAKNYQSAPAIIQGTLEILNRKWIDGLLLFGIDIIYICFASVIYENDKVKDIFKLFLKSFIILLIPLSVYLWPQAYYSILADSILGIAFGFILYFYYTNNYDRFSIILLCLLGFFLSCSKANGFLLSIIAFSLIYFDIFVIKKKKIKNFFQKINSKFIKMVLIFSPLITVFFTFFSWTIILKLLNYSSYESVDFLSLIINKEFYNFQFPAFLKVLLLIFIDYKYYILFNISVWIFVCFNYFTKKEKINFIVNLLIFIFGIVAYIYFLFLVCGTMPSLDISTVALRRYLYTIVIAILILNTFLILYYSKIKKIVGLTFCVLVSLYFFTPANSQLISFISNAYVEESKSYRENYDSVSKKLNKINTKNNVIYFISTNEIDILVVNYDIFPNSLSYMPLYNVINPNDFLKFLGDNNNIAIFKTYTQKEKNRIKSLILNDNIYIYIYKLDLYTKKIYGDFFDYYNVEMKENTLYKIDIKNYNIIKQS